MAADYTTLARFCLEDIRHVKEHLQKTHYISEFDVDYEIRYTLFLAALIDGKTRSEEADFINAVIRIMGWSSMHESLLKNKIEKQPGYQLEDLKLATEHAGLGRVVFRCACAMAAVCGEESKDKKILIDNLHEQLFRSKSELGQQAKQERAALYKQGKLKELTNASFASLPESAISAEKDTGPKTVDECMAELDALVGLSEVKEEIKLLMSFLDIQKKRKEASLSQANMSLHMVFTGNPGTGKTTVARLVAQLYRALGFLGKGHLVETDRSKLVGQYIGHTEAKTTDVIDEALDGILFIDEAYSLNKGSENDFGQEAIDTLVKRMEDDRDRFVLIVAGYEQEMEGFINANPGLRSRFNTFIKFANYDASELLAIFEILCKSNDYTIDKSTREKLERVFKKKIEELTTGFGNGRFVRNLFEQILRNQAFRLSIISRDLSKNDLMEIKPVDIVVDD